MQLKRMIEIGIDARGAKTGAAEVNAALTGVVKTTGAATTEINKLDASLTHTKDVSHGASSEVERLSHSVGGLGGAVHDVGHMVGGLVATFAGLFAVHEVVHALTELEDILFRIKSVTGLTGESLEHLGHGLEEITTRVPITVSSLGQIAVAAARMGVRGVEDITKFADSVAKLSVIAGTDGAETARIMGAVLKSTGEGAAGATGLANAYAALAKVTNALPSDIVAMSESVARATTLYKIGAVDAASLAAAFAEVGLESRAGGTVLVQSLTAMDEAIRHGGEKMKIMGDLTGLTRDELEALFKSHPAEAFRVFAASLAKASDAGASVNNILTTMGLGGDILLRTLPAIGHNVEGLSQKFDVAHAAAENLTSLPDKFTKFSDIIPRIKGGLESIINTVAGASGVTGALKSMGLAAADALGWLTHYPEALSAIGSGAAAYAVIALVPTFVNLASAIKSTTIATKVLNAVMMANPFGLLAVAIGTAVAALVYFKDTVITFGDESVTVGELVVATFQELGVSIVETWKKVVEMFNEFWPWIRMAATGAWQELSDTFVTAANLIGFNWKDLWDDLGKIAKTVVNGTIAIIFGIGDTLGIIAGRLWSFFAALGELSFNSFDDFKKSLSKVKDTMGDALSPSGLWKDVKISWKEEFDRDFVGEMVGAGKTFATDFKEAIKQIIGGTDSLDLLELAMSGAEADMDAFGERVLARAKRIHEAREALEGHGHGTELPTSPLYGGDNGVDASKFLNMGEGAEAARKSIEKLNKAMDEQIEQASQVVDDQMKLGEAHELAAARVQINELAEKAYADTLEEGAKVVEDYIDKVKKFQEARRIATGTAGMALANRQIDYETDTLGKSITERMHATEITKYLTDAELKYGKGSEEAANATKKFTDRLSELDRLKDFRKLADDIGGAFGKAFEDIVFKSQTAGEAIKSMIQDVSRMIFQELVTKQISRFFADVMYSGFGGAHASGNVFNQGSVIPFAAGGIVSSPTLFPMSGGRHGLAGEAGPEAIMPLTRGSDGKLGVAATGRGGPSQIVNVNMTVVTKDADSFRQSNSQITSRVKRLIRGR